jgi:predicted phage terminase large subunit-like protein
MSHEESSKEIETLTPSELIALTRNEFATFVEVMFPVLHSSEPLIWAPYIDLIAVALQSRATSKRRRLLINLPPGFLKSMLVSIFYVAWRLGRDPTAKFICISYGDDLAHYLSIKTRELMLSPLYRRLFPETVLAKKAEDLITTTKGGYRYATAVGSDITGFRANEIIIDDPLQPDDATSGLKKDAVMNWIQASVLSRFKDPATGVFILVMHRLAPDDPSGQLEETGGYFVVKLPLVAEKEEKFTHNDQWLFYRKPGELLNPTRLSVKDVENLKREIPPHVYDSQYQQRPRIGGSGMCSIERLARYDKAPPFELTIHSWDIAATPDGNFTVCTKWGTAKLPDLGDVLYLIDLVRIRVEIPDVREAIIMHDKLNKPDLIVIDGAGIGIGLYQDLWRKRYHHLYLASQTSNHQQTKKIERFGKALLNKYDGRVQYLKSAPYLDSLFAEFAAFPNGKYDDQVDSVTQLVAYPRNALMFARQKHRLRSKN